MNINQLRTPEGLNHYLNVVLGTLPTKLPDAMLQTLLWQKIKNDFILGEEKIKQLYVDDNDNVFGIEINDLNHQFIIGYLHLPNDIHIKYDDYCEKITNTAIEFVSDLKNLSLKNNWTNYKLFIVTTYRLSHYPKIRLEKFSNDAKYMYLTDSPESKNTKFQIALDTEMTEYIEGDILLKKLLGKNN